MKREVLLVWTSILVALQILTAGAALGDFIGEDVAGLCILIVAALQGGTVFYVRGQVTPNANVAARLTSDGHIVAGDAASYPNESEVLLSPQE